MSVRRVLSGTSIALVAVALAASPALAAWPISGTPIATGAGDQNTASLAPDGTGGAIVCWLDGTTSPNRVRALRMLHSGMIAPGWVAGGNTVVVAQPWISGPTIVSDGAGGAIFLWQDSRNYATTSTDLFAQHLLADGSLAPGWPAGGLPVCIAIGNQTYQRLITDGAGGAVAVWNDTRDNANGSIYALRIQGDGTSPAGWNVNGNNLGIGWNSPIPVPDGTGGAVVGWYGTSSGGLTGSDVLAQRILGTGDIAPGWPAGGAVVCAAPRDQFTQASLEDGSGGAYFCFSDYRLNDDRVHLFAQHFTGGGTIDPQWPALGLAISVAPQNQSQPFLVSDGAGGFIALWQDWRYAFPPDIPNNTDIYAQRVSAAGVPQWTLNGVPVCSQVSPQWNPVGVPDGAGGVLAAWLDYRLSSYPTYFQHLGSDGLPMAGYTLDGALIPEAAYGNVPVMIGDTYGGVILTWASYGSWGDQDVFVAHVAGPNEAAGVESPLRSPLVLEGVSPNPARDLFHVSFALAGSAPATIELLDLSGRRIDSREVGAFGAGRQSVEFDAHVLSPGIYLVRLKQGTHSEVKRISVMR